VVFGAPDWCVPCQRLHPHVVKLAKQLDIPVVDVDVDKAEAIKNTYDIMSVPRVYEFVEGKPVRELKGRTILALQKELAA
jgi:thiol-disulfide isomerase/thioredoxin